MRRIVPRRGGENPGDGAAYSAGDGEEVDVTRDQDFERIERARGFGRRSEREDAARNGGHGSSAADGARTGTGLRGRLPWRAVLGLLAAALVAAGCGAPAGEEGADATGAAAREFLSVGTAPPGGTFFVVGGALAEVLDAHGPWRVTAEATKGTQENIRRLERGELDLALANSSITYFAVRGAEGWERPYPMAAAMTLAPNVGMFLAREGSGIQSLGDLVGRRVVVGPAGAGFEYFLRPILAAHGVALDDLTVLHNTQSAAVDMLGDGSADAVFLGGGVPTPSITQAAAGGGVVFLPYDPAAVERLVADYTFFEHATIPAGTYTGLDRDFPALDVGSMHLIVAEDAPGELVYELVRTIWENREEVAARHAAGRAIQPSVVARDTGTRFHPGAERFYREHGMWPEEPSAAAPASTEPATTEPAPAEPAPAEPAAAEPVS